MLPASILHFVILRWSVINLRLYYSANNLVEPLRCAVIACRIDFVLFRSCSRTQARIEPINCQESLDPK